MKRFARAGTVLLFLAFPAAAAAQVPAHTPGDWKRADTEHFLFLYPDDLSGWALHMAARMEAVHAAVTELVGYAPEDRVTVLVDDPGNVSNGSMNPGPLLYMWPTPPNPRSVIGENRGWGEILAVHEFAHAAHLTRPSRNPVERFLTSLIPIPVSRLMLTTPRWATEGYATLIEGRLTGSGRPHGVWRPAILRTWALEGQIPTYGEVSGSDEFLGGSMAYLVGSAYLEWLLEREGADDERLADVWRRLTARQKRSFDEAFTGVFGAPPGELYGLFSVDLTERALAVRGAVEAAGGVVDGELFQRLTWTVGDPAVSPDGARLAVRLTSRDGPSRLVVMRTTPDTLTTEARERYEEIFAADPEDVEPVRRRPRPQEKLATLYSALGRAYSAPAWMPDGQGILVVRSDLEENVRARPDLFLWRWESGELRRVTRGAAIREAAPAPDGSWAVGVRCLHGLCDLVRIELDDGALVPLTDTDPLRPYYHPRVSPDGETIVASVQTEDGWRLVALEADGSGERVLGPDDGAARFDAEFLDDGRLLVTSTRGGIHDIEIVDPATGAVVPVTRAVGAAVAPTTARAPAADSLADIFFLSLHSRGWDLRRIARDRRPATPIVMTEPRLSPAATVPLGAVDTFPVASLGEPRPYGLGPRFRIVLPVVHLAQDGYGGGLAVGGTDPIGRLSWQLQAAYGSDAAPAGGAFRLRYRGIRPWLHVEGFLVRNRLPGTPAGGSAGETASGTSDSPLALFDGDGHAGALAALELRAQRLGLSQGVRAGGSVGRLAGSEASRALAFGEYDAALRQGPGHWWLGQTLRAHGAVGRTGSLDWTRWLVSGSLELRGEERGLRATATHGRTDAPAGAFEAFAVGGTGALLHDPAVLSQQLAMPALALGEIRGDRVTTVMAELDGVLPVTSFFWAGDAEGNGRDWTRLIGSRVDLDTDPIPYLRLPGARIRAGIGYLLDGVAEGDWRAWLTVGYTP